MLNIQTLMNNIFRFIGIVVIVTVVSFYFAIIAVFVAVINISISYLFLKVVRELF